MPGASSSPLRLAVIGAGAIGREHIRRIVASPEASLAAVVDPAPDTAGLAAECGAPHFASFDAMLEKLQPDGVIVATPNVRHVEDGLAAIGAGLPVLIEKPLAHSLAAGREIVAAADAARVPVLTGHHRRHGAIITRAKDIIESGALGRLVTAHVFFWITKPDDYFDTQWRREPGAGPVLLNLIHDVDLMRHLVGEIVAVQALQSNVVRGHAVEETAAVTLQFANGALGTASVSDTVAAPWSWEMTSGENKVYPRTNEPCYFLGGTEGALRLPDLSLFTYREKRSWWEPLARTQETLPDADPLVRQIAQFCRVIRGEEAPLVSAREGLATLQVIEAIHKAARTGGLVRVED